MSVLNTTGLSASREVHFDELLRGLSENYSAIYYVDFDEDKIHPFRLNPVIEKNFGTFFRTNPTYEEAIRAYMEVFVIDADKEDFEEVTQYHFLREQLKDVLAYSHEYRVLRDGRELVFRFKIANLDGIGELHHAVMGFADVSAEKTVNFSGYQIGQKVLIVMNDAKKRSKLSDILEGQYEIVTAEDGQQALDRLDEQSEEIAIVITDIEMPVMGGVELVRKMKRIRRYSAIPIMVIVKADKYESESTAKLEAELLTLGVSDFFIYPFHRQLIKNRVRSVVELRESTSILTAMEKDPLTELYSKEFFYLRVEQQMKDFPDEDYVMWVSDIQGLKIINDRYGISTGNEVLQIQAENQALINGYIFGGRIEGDKLAAFVYESAVSEILERAKKPAMGIEFPIPNVIFKNGIYRVRCGPSLAPQGMVDRALLAIHRIKDSYGVYIAEYNDVIRQDILMQRQISSDAEESLEAKQFFVHYQPKMGIESGRTEGAEALVRWEHPELGFMSPGTFIPIFEKNGFIQNLDYYVWEEVCKDIRDWKAQGMRIVPISVNVSRRDFEDENLAKKVIDLVDSYGIEHKYFHIEVTESSYSDNPALITETIAEFHRNGFVIELDDFGAGYSSMTALSDLELDILKLDTSLIRKDKPGSGNNVLEFSMQLAQLLQLKTVAEGVETKEQKERIASLGGDYLQGYYYSKPLPKLQFEEHLLPLNA